MADYIGTMQRSAKYIFLEMGRIFRLVSKSYLSRVQKCNGTFFQFVFPILGRADVGGSSVSCADLDTAFHPQTISKTQTVLEVQTISKKWNEMHII